MNVQMSVLYMFHAVCALWGCVLYFRRDVLLLNSLPSCGIRRDPPHPRGRQVFDLLDDGDGNVDAQEFIDGMMRVSAKINVSTRAPQPGVHSLAVWTAEVVVSWLCWLLQLFLAGGRRLSCSCFRGSSVLLVSFGLDRRRGKQSVGEFSYQDSS